MAKPLNLLNQKFGHLTAIKYICSNNRKNRLWLCKCDCGEYAEILATNLKSGNTISCGCRHGFNLKEYIKNRIKIDVVTGCWMWQGKIGGKYGKAKWKGKDWIVHRLAYIAFVGPITKGKFVCHNCPRGDNPACCNPEHLWLGTAAMNSADMVKKGRSAHNTATRPDIQGSKHHRSKFTEKQVSEIRSEYKKGNISQRVLARKYGVTRGAIVGIVKKLTWKHVK